MSQGNLDLDAMLASVFPDSGNVTMEQIAAEFARRTARPGTLLAGVKVEDPMERVM